MIEVKSVNISLEKGTIKKSIPEILLDSSGVAGDAHSGSWHRQVSLLGTESILKFSSKAKREISFGEFAENITTEGEILYKMNPLDVLFNDTIRLEVTQIGKKCHGDNCAIFREVGNCVMPKEGIFARVINGGIMKPGDRLEYQPHVFKIAIITLSDRASKGEYKDLSGQILETRIASHFESKNRKSRVQRILIPDEREILEMQFKKCLSDNYDIIITTGGTGIGPRDITPEVVNPLLEKEIPGIMDMVRYKYGQNIPAALLSRSVAGLTGKTLIFTLPGSPKAVEEYMAEILPVLDHAILMVHGLGH
ncbi:MAG: molybdenum cofactor synthesis protein [Bacteroidales bacterium]|nr:molybdenum cofactor synthesis protein [Bacteroidales bacterium]MCB8999949.1 molybdenum cofactor synthesis protein [Bacteroidales bacterium]MCB9012600.1 molybdenum cofactor synthesis protein [Bacteroidales bacterium]